MMITITLYDGIYSELDSGRGIRYLVERNLQSRPGRQRAEPAMQSRYTTSCSSHEGCRLATNRLQGGIQW